MAVVLYLYKSKRDNMEISTGSLKNNGPCRYKQQDSFNIASSVLNTSNGLLIFFLNMKKYSGGPFVIALNKTKIGHLGLLSMANHKLLEIKNMPENHLSLQDSGSAICKNIVTQHGSNIGIEDLIYRDQVQNNNYQIKNKENVKDDSTKLSETASGTTFCFSIPSKMINWIS